MCLDYDKDDQPFREGRTRTFFKVLMLDDDRLVSPVFDDIAWWPGERVSCRPSVSLGAEEWDKVYAGFHVYIDREQAENQSRGWSHATTHVVLEVECRDDDCVMVSAKYREAVYLKVTVSKEVFEAALAKAQHDERKRLEMLQFYNPRSW